VKIVKMPVMNTLTSTWNAKPALTLAKTALKPVTIISPERY